MNKRASTETSMQPLGDSVLSVIAIIAIAGIIVWILAGTFKTPEYYYSKNNMAYFKQAVDNTPLYRERYIPVNIEEKTIIAVCGDCFCLCEESCQKKELKQVCFAGYKAKIDSKNNQFISWSDDKNSIKVVKTKINGEPFVRIVA